MVMANIFKKPHNLPADRPNWPLAQPPAHGPEGGVGRVGRVARVAATLGLSLALGACSTFNWFNASAAQSIKVPTMRGTDRDSLTALGKEMAARGDHSGAIALFRQAHRSSLFDIEPLLQLGRSLMAVGRYGEAIEILQLAYERDPGRVDVLSALGKAYLVLGQPTFAERQFRAAVALERAPAMAYSGLGVSLEIAGQHAQALANFERGLALYPDSLDLRNNKALVLALSGSPEQAIEILTAVVLSPGAGQNYRANLSLAYVFAGDTRRAYEIATIDQDPLGARESVSQYSTLKALDPDTRMRALLYGIVEDRRDIEFPAIEAETVANQDDAVARVVGEPQPKPELRPEPAPEPEPVPEPAPVAAPEPKPEPTYELPPLMDAEGWAVQIAAYRYAREVMPGWRELRERFYDIIGDLEPRRSEVDFGERSGSGPGGFFYRLNAGPLADFPAAKGVCDQLLDRGGACWIRPPEPAEGHPPQPGPQTNDEHNDPNP
jgi:Flp pilus assembly protein TadD